MLLQANRFKGVRCEDCGFAAHKRCSEHTLPDCRPEARYVKRMFAVDLTTLCLAHSTPIPPVVTKCIYEVNLALRFANFLKYYLNVALRFLHFMIFISPIFLRFRLRHLIDVGIVTRWHGSWLNLSANVTTHFWGRFSLVFAAFRKWQSRNNIRVATRPMPSPNKWNSKGEYKKRYVNKIHRAHLGWSFSDFRLRLMLVCVLNDLPLDILYVGMRRYWAVVSLMRFGHFCLRLSRSRNSLLKKCSNNIGWTASSTH